MSKPFDEQAEELEAEVERLKAELAALARERRIDTEQISQLQALANRPGWDALTAEVERLKSDSALWDAHLREEQKAHAATRAELKAERERHHATAGELNKAVTWLDRCAWARATIDLDAGPLEVQLAEALGRVERLTAALSHLLGVGHSLKAFAGTMLRWREQPGVDFSDEAARIVRLAKENHQTIKAALLKETKP